MNVTKPEYYDQFNCIASQCPDTCCVGWQVILDPEHLEFYKTIPGKLGEMIRSGICVENEEASFALCNGRCAMLRPDGLCKIQYALGKDALSSVCGFYPRFVTELGLIREQGLSISCPEVARMVLTHKEPIAYSTTVTEEPLKFFHDIEPEVMLAVRQGREKAFKIIEDHSISFPQRLLQILDIAEEPETGISATAGEAQQFYSRVYGVYLGLEILRPEWKELLQRCQQLTKPPELSQSLCWERLMSYFIYKYALRSAMDNNFATVIRRSVLNILLLRDMAAKAMLDPIYLVQLFGKETEHNEENMDELNHAVENDPLLSTHSLRRILLFELS